MIRNHNSATRCANPALTLETEYENHPTYCFALSLTAYAHAASLAPWLHHADKLRRGVHGWLLSPQAAASADRETTAESSRKGVEVKEDDHRVHTSKSQERLEGGGSDMLRALLRRRAQRRQVRILAAKRQHV